VQALTQFVPQVLPNRTHPENEMSAESGYILRGTKVINNPRSADHMEKFGDGAKQTKERPPKRNKMR
jgi:hypothetical protein